MILYETISQPLIFLYIFLIGIGCGLVFDVRNYLTFLCNKNKIVGVILDVISGIVISLLFLFCVLQLNYGQIRFYLILGFGLGIAVERFSFGKLIAKLSLRCYNGFRYLIAQKYGKRKKEIKKKDVGR